MQNKNLYHAPVKWKNEHFLQSLCLKEDWLLWKYIYHRGYRIIYAEESILARTNFMVEKSILVLYKAASKSIRHAICLSKTGKMA